MVHPLPVWVERMTTSHLRSAACSTPRADDLQPGATVVGKGSTLSGGWSGRMGKSTLDVLRIACRPCRTWGSKSLASGDSLCAYRTSP